MVKRAAKKKQTAAERAEIDRDREAAHAKADAKADAKAEKVVVEPTQEAVDYAEEVMAENEAKSEQGVPEPGTPNPVVEQEAEAAAESEGAAEAAAEAETEEDIAKPNSVVATKFKQKYLDNARAKGIAGKAAKRSNWDWLAQEIAKVCLDDKHKISISKFTELLALNGVDYSKWTNRNKGWEGRFRMTGRVALQKKVADAGVLKTVDGELPAPADFIDRFKTKV